MDAAFLAACADPFGEILAVRITAASDYGPWDLTENWPVVAMGPISFVREREFGVVQGQAWQVTLNNTPGTFPVALARGWWVALETGFAVANTWTVVAQGRITRVISTAAATVTLEVTDAVVGLLGATLPRDIRFQSTGWISEVKTQGRALASGSWDSTVPLVLNTPAAADDETFTIEFTSTTAYKIGLQDGTATQTGTTAANKTIANVAGDAGIITIPAAGWAGSTFAAGDIFVFSTARARTAAERSPIWMIKHLVTDFVGLAIYDVLADGYFATPFYDVDAWDTLAEAARGDGHQITGTFAAGTSIVAMIQDCLKIVHGSIFPTPTGQLGLWVISPSVSGVVSLNGNAAAGPVSILDGLSVADGVDQAVSAVIFRYLTQSGADAEYRVVDPDSELPFLQETTISVDWELRQLSAKTAADQFLARYRNGAKVYTVPATLAAMPAAVGGGVTLTDAALSFDAVTNEVTGVELDLIENKVTLTVQSDPVAGYGWFYLNLSLLDGTAVIW
jgi:hypothetical protein